MTTPSCSALHPAWARLWLGAWRSGRPTGPRRHRPGRRRGAGPRPRAERGRPPVRPHQPGRSRRAGAGVTRVLRPRHDGWALANVRGAGVRGGAVVRGGRDAPLRPRGMRGEQGGTRPLAPRLATGARRGAGSRRCGSARPCPPTSRAPLTPRSSPQRSTHGAAGTGTRGLHVDRGRRRRARRGHRHRPGLPCRRVRGSAAPRTVGDLGPYLTKPTRPCATGSSTSTRRGRATSPVGSRRGCRGRH